MLIEKINRFFPKSLLSRLSLTMMLGVLVVQITGNWIWTAQIKKETEHSSREAAHNLGLSLISTLAYFKKLPPNYRSIVLEQIRSIGGTRYFISIHNKHIKVDEIPDSELKSVVISELDSILKQELGATNTSINFAMPEKLTVFDNDTLLIDLPDHWTRQTLVLQPKPAPILVVQTEIEPGVWFYIATLMPDPFFLEKNNPLTLDRIVLQSITLISVLLLSFLLVRWLTQPLKTLSIAAQAFGKGIEHKPLPTSGSREYSATAKAFNEMEQRIQRFIDDRERLFASISHDLRTPITRLRLRTELLDDDLIQQEFDEDLIELELMVKGALQSVKDTDIHENQTLMDMDRFMKNLVAQGKQVGHPMSYISTPVQPIAIKPLALKRAILNLVNNAIHYGQCADIQLEELEQQLAIIIRDKGPGIPEESMTRLFDPYVRLEHGKQINKQGMGLGMGIAQNIINAHGGELILTNMPEGGLEARIILPKN